MSTLRTKVRELKHTMVHLLENQCGCRSFEMKFHLLDHICYDLERLRIIQFLDAAAYEHNNDFLKEHTSELQ